MNFAEVAVHNSEVPSVSGVRLDMFEPRSTHGFRGGITVHTDAHTNFLQLRAGKGNNIEDTKSIMTCFGDFFRIYLHIGVQNTKRDQL